MSAACEAAETRVALATAWARLPEPLKGPTQFMGRQYVGCGATIGTMPRCDFSCRGCYLGAEANRAKPSPVAEIKDQLRQLRSWLGPAGNVQITDGEVSLRAENEVIEIIRYARAIGLVPMLMSHGETFRRRPGLLERFMTEGGLTELSLHIDTTMRGRRDGYAQARTEAELDGLRAEFAGLIRGARRRTRRRLEVASTVTVTQENLAGVPGIVRWFLQNADAFKMVSFQPLASVGRTRADLHGVSVDELWTRIVEGTGNPDIGLGTGSLGHPACSRFVQGLAAGKGDDVRFVPLYRQDRPREMAVLSELLDRLGGESFRLDGPAKAAARALRMLANHGGFLLSRVLPHALRAWLRTRALRPRYFCLVSHHFMNAEEATTSLGKERLAVCAFRVPIKGVLQPMCAVNALGLREEFYRSASALEAVA